jgi:hypothetical protein
MFATTGLALLATVGTLALILSFFRPAGVRRRVLVAGLLAGVVPIAAWLAHVTSAAHDPGSVVTEALLVTGVAVLFTINGCNWASLDNTPDVLVARTIQFQSPGREEFIIPSEYVTDPQLRVPQHETMYHLPRLRRAPAVRTTAQR